jgi:hypothetical protein
MIFDAETAGFAITGGNDKTIRYWSLNGGNEEHFVVNSPYDKECLYNTESTCGNDSTEVIH